VRYFTFTILVIAVVFSCADNKPDKLIEGRDPNALGVWFVKGTTREQVKSFIKRFSVYGLKETIDHGDFSSFWFDEDLVSDDTAFLEHINKEDIVEAAGFPPIITIPTPVETNRDGIQ